VRKFQPQVVHVHGGRAGFFLAAAVVGVPTVYTVHGYHFVQRNPVFRWFAVNAERLTAFSARRVVLVSNHDARVAQTYKILTNPDKGVVIHSGIPLEKVPRARPRTTKHVGFVGRLTYPKDPQLFLEVIERLPGYAATIVGGGELEAAVETQIRRRGITGVRMLGGLSHPETLQELSQLGTVVMTSRWEGLPILPMEAMWSGVPIVATNVGGLGEIIEDGRSGLLVSSRSADELARAVVRLSEDAVLRERVISGGRARVRELFSEERMLCEIFKMYQRVAR